MSKVDGTSALRTVTYIPALKEEVKKTRVAAYARVSSDSEDQRHSFSAQVIHYTNLIENEPMYELVDIYADEGISGTSTEKRTEFLRMIDDARNGKIDKIIAKSLSRFSRNQLDSISTIRELKSLGIDVVFEKEGIHTANLTSENILSLYSMLAERESLSISQNCKKSIRMRMEKGEYIASHIAYGYRLENGKLSIYEPESEIVKRIFKEYLSGYGMAAICKRLNQDNIQRKDGKVDWQPTSLLCILKNERYIGDMLLQKTYNEDIMPYKTKRNHGELTQCYIKNTHQPIITDIEFEIVKIMLEKNKESAISKQQDWLLNRKIKCSNCGRSFKRKVTREKVYWVCSTKSTSISPCPSTQIAETKVYESFINLYNKLKANYKSLLIPMLTQLDNLEEVKYKDNPQLKDINKKIAELLEQNHMMTGLMSEGILDSALFISKTDEIAMKIQNLKKSKAIILKNRNSNKLIKSTEELISLLVDAPEYITEMNDELFEELIEKITTKDNKILNFHLINGLVLMERIENDTK